MFKKLISLFTTAKKSSNVKIESDEERSIRVKALYAKAREEVIKLPKSRLVIYLNDGQMLFETIDADFEIPWYSDNYYLISSFENARGRAFNIKANGYNTEDRFFPVSSIREVGIETL